MGCLALDCLALDCLALDCLALDRLALAKFKLSDMAEMIGAGSIREKSIWAMVVKISSLCIEPPQTHPYKKETGRRSAPLPYFLLGFFMPYPKCD